MTSIGLQSNCCSVFKQNLMEKISLLQEIVKQLQPDVQDVIIYDPYHIRLTCVCKVKEAKEQQSDLHLSPWSKLWCFTYENLSADLLARLAERQSLLRKKGMKRRVALLAPDHPSLESISLLHVFDQIVYYKDLLDKVDLTCKRGSQIPLQYGEAAQFTDKHSK